MPDEIIAAWEANKPFYLTGTVHSPYSGCLQMPNVWIVTPIGCSLQAELMDSIPARYSPHREDCARRYEEVRARVRSAEYALESKWGDYVNEFDFPWKNEEMFTAEDRETMCTLFVAWDKLDDLRIEMSCEMDEIAARNPAMEQPPLVCWPLIATGPGLGMDAIHSLTELLEVISCSGVGHLATRDVWPEALLGTRHKRPYTAIGNTIDQWEVGTYGEPINDQTYAAERYWMRALEVADSEYDLQLPWSCSQCDAVIEYAGDGGYPSATGSKGDGGIGEHYFDVMCSECISEGMCRVCEEDGNVDSIHGYDPKIVEHGWYLCEWCTEKLFADSGLVGEIDLPDTIELQWYKAKPTDVPMLRLCIDDSPIEELLFDEEAVFEAVESMSIEHLSPFYDHSYGISLSGTVVENLAYNNID